MQAKARAPSHEKTDPCWSDVCARRRPLQAESDPRVVGLFVYRLKDLWQARDMTKLDACQNPFGTGLGR